MRSLIPAFIAVIVMAGLMVGVWWLFAHILASAIHGHLENQHA